MEPLAELRKHVQGQKFVTGTSEVMKMLKAGNASMVFVAANCPANVKEQLNSYSSACELVELPVPNDELGVMCKKPFSIAVVGIPK